MIFTTVSGCTTTPTLKEKSLPPVFSDMNTIGGSYRGSLIFPPFDTSDFIFPDANDYLTFKPAELSLNSDLPSVPDKLIAYKIIRPVVDEAYARNMMQLIGFSSGTFNYYESARTYNIYVGDITNPGPSMSIDKDGRIDVIYADILTGGGGSPDQESIDAAQNWLKSRSLYPKGIVNVKILPYVVEVYKDAPEGLTFSSSTYAKTVIFSPTLDGYELFGIGAMFYIGYNGKILQVHINIPEFKPYCYVKVQQPEAAIGTLRDYLQNPAKFGAAAPECVMGGLSSASVKVNNISLKYFAMLPADVSQPAYAQPVYITYGKVDKPELPQNAYIMVDAVSR